MGTSKNHPPPLAVDHLLRSNLKLKHLHLLVVLDQFRHLGRAADHLALTQPAVSKSLADIEALFGQPLFTRSNRGTEPTDAGATVVRLARSVLVDYERTRDDLAALDSGAAGRTQVGVMVVALPGLLTPAVRRLKALAPQTRVLIEEGDLTRLLPRLRVGEIDVLVGRLEPGHAAPDLITEALYDEPMALVVRPGHPLLGEPGDAVSWAVLAAQPWVMPPHWATTRTKLHQLFYRAGVNPPSDVVDTTSFLALLGGVRQRDAVGFLARSVARQMADDGLLALLPLDVPMDLPPVGLITLRGRALGAATVRLMACVRAVAQER